jgi:RHS repeat-associated protein
MTAFSNQSGNNAEPRSFRDGASFINNAQKDTVKTKSNLIQAPSITMPKGGGAIKSIDEKFSVNAANGTATFSIPLPLSPGRNGAAPALVLSYNSGGGNSIFGLGWHADVPSIQRKTEKELPEYKDSEESDTFIFSGAEDLVPELVKDAGGHWVKNIIRKDDTVITRYRPRIEGSFARIEKIEEHGNIYWRVRTKENVVSVFGKSDTAKLFSPVTGDAYKIFKWSLEYSYDDKGNFTSYYYKKENTDSIPPSLHEKNRLNGIAACTNSYLKGIKYGNSIAYYEGDELPKDFLFELVFDFGEHDKDAPAVKETSKWPVRKDPYSDYRSGFEIRTYRLCSRILMFHHFKEELGQDDYLVKSMDLVYDEQAHLTYLEKIIQTGYIWNADGSLRSKKSLPPLEFSYFKPGFSREVKEVSSENLIHAPAGLDNHLYQWIDLYSEGISGILTEQGAGWYYKENWGNGAFSAARLINPKPSFRGLEIGTLAIQELEANGEKYVVSTGPGLKGYFGLRADESWESFHAFDAYPNIDLRDPNLKMIDLNGDGMPELLLSLEQEFIWYPSKGKAGYDDPATATRYRDEEMGPAILFANKDEQMLIATADMSGDGLADIVLITCSGVSYYPNLGYGHFGARVSMEMEGCFDSAADFNPGFIHLTDVDGSGTTDIIYAGGAKIQVWFNQSGNTLAAVSEFFNPFPELDEQSKISFVDLLGNGTSCLVWSSALPGHSQSPLRYIDLMGGRKPHVMHFYKNNLGKEVTLEFTSSTQYYLADKKQGKKWITKLPFPVQCVSKVIVADKVSQTRFATEYSYHHGYYDAVEREFRGFARVDVKDVESYETYVRETQASGAVNTVERDLFQAAVITKTWYHTGAFINRENIFQQLQHEYYPGTALQQRILPEGLTADELIECCRALKGLPLRQEVYSEEGDATIQKHPYTVTQHNYDIRLLQPKAQQEHAVFLSHEEETLAFHFERNPLDPRIAHTINVETDRYGNVLQSAAIVYGRKNPDTKLPTDKDREKQSRQLITYSKNKFTTLIDSEQAYRLPLSCETQTFELNTPAPAAAFFTRDEIRQRFEAAAVKLYEQDAASNEKRKIEHACTLFLKNDLTGAMPFGVMDTLALPYENYLLAFTPSLVQHIYGEKFDEDTWRNKARYVRFEGDNNYWITSGRFYFHPDPSGNPDVNFAKGNFYQPVAFEDNFGHLSRVFYDDQKLFLNRAIDAKDNETSVEAFNYRVLAPYLLRNANDNRSGIRFDALGLVTHTFLMGKQNESKGDPIDINSAELSAVDEPSSVLEYQFRYFDTNGKLPNRVKTRAREQHFHSDHANVEIKWQESYSYSDGSGHDVLKKAQAEPGLAPERDAQGKLVYDASGQLQQKDTAPALRWIGNGRTIFNNKGNPVKQYEPYFDSTPEYNTESELTELGYTSVLYYDAVSRLIKTKHANGSFSKVEFDAWMQQNFDENDTVKDSEWYTDRINGAKGEAEQDSAQKAAVHHHTPSVVYLDNLGRSFLSASHNKTKRSNETIAEEFYYTGTELDIEGNARSITDARGNVVMSWQYDMLGNICYQHSMDAGDRWMLADAMGKSMRLWDNRAQTFSYEYDELHRPLHLIVSTGTGNRIFEQYQYGENVADDKLKNLRGKLFKHTDTAGLLTYEAFDFKGNSLASTRRLLNDYKNQPDWANSPVLDNEIFATATAYDALNRPVQMTAPDGSIFLQQYNEASLLDKVAVKIKGANMATPFVSNINYNAKGQREDIFYGNNTKTKYEYDRETYRLTRLLTTADNGSSIKQDLHYTYDPAGNITRQLDNAQKTIFYGGQQVEAHIYDAIYRLIEASGREHTGQAGVTAQDNFNDDWCKLSLQPNSPVQLRNYSQHYFYDTVGNILKMQHTAGAVGSWTRTNNYNPANNQLTKTVVGNQEYSYTYNEHGSMLTMPHLQQIDWNFREEMQHVNLGGGGEVWYSYDSGGQRMRKVVERSGNKIEERIYLGVFEIYRERTGSTVTLERASLHVMDDKQRIAVIETRTKGNDGSPEQLMRYQYSNHLGSTGLELDENANVISYEEYHPYGTTAYQATDASRQVSRKRYRYTGMERDEESGLNYHSARYYVPWLGRWMNCDPESLVDGLNLFIYVGDNPTDKIDVSGTQGTRQKYRDDFIRRRTDSPRVRSVTGATAGDDSWKTPKRERGWYRQEENRTRSSSPRRWRLPDSGRKSGKMPTTEVSHPLNRPFRTHGNTGGPGRPDTPQDNANKYDIEMGRPTREGVKPLPKTIMPPESKPRGIEPPKPESKPTGIEPPKPESKPVGIEPPKPESKPTGIEAPRPEKKPEGLVPPEVKHEPYTKETGKTPPIFVIAKALWDLYKPKISVPHPSVPAPPTQQQKAAAETTVATTVVGTLLVMGAVVWMSPLNPLN